MKGKKGGRDVPGSLLTSDYLCQALDARLPADLHRLSSSFQEVMARYLTLLGSGWGPLRVRPDNVVHAEPLDGTPLCEYL